MSCLFVQLRFGYLGLFVFYAFNDFVDWFWSVVCTDVIFVVFGWFWIEVVCFLGCGCLIWVLTCLVCFAVFGFWVIGLSGLWFV